VLKRIVVSATTVLALLATACPALAVDVTPPRRDEPGVFGVTIGAEYSSGDYGTSSDTDIWYFPFSLRYEQNDWFFRLTVPYLVVSGPGNVLIMGGSGMGSHQPGTGGGGGGGGGGGAVATTDSRTESGLGDIIGTVSYTLQRGASGRPGIDLTGKVYLGTASETKGLGTGENDYAVQLDLAQDVGAVTLFGSGGYRITGDPPGTDYDDVLYGTVGVERDFNRNTLGGALDVQQAVVSGGDAFAELTGYLTVRPDKSSKLNAYLLLGLTDAAPDWGVGITYTWFY
jgi:hypothetical protein